MKDSELLAKVKDTFRNADTAMSQCEHLHVQCISFVKEARLIVDQNEGKSLKRNLEDHLENL